MDLSLPRASHSNLFRELFTLLPHQWEREGGLLGPCQLWLTLMSMSVRGKKGYGRALAEMKETMGRHFGWDDRRPSPSALSQARKKLTPELCASTLALILERCTAARESPRVRFLGRRLVACDGTNLTLPVRTSLRDHFGVPKCSHGDCLAPQAALTVLFDVGAHQPLAFSLERCRYPERKALLDLEHHLRPGDLLIADRGYPSRELFARMIGKRRDFLIRAAARHANTIAEFRQFIASGKDEDMIELRQATKGAASADTITVRVIRFRDDNVLVTTISNAEANADDLRALYLNRWGIETAFGEMKGFRGLEDFHARTPDGIRQEVTAVFLFMLLESELEGRARQHHAAEIATTTSTTSGAHQANDIRFNRLLLGDWVVYLLNAATHGPRALAKKFNEAIADLWRARMRYKPGRAFPRETKSPYGKWRSKPRITGKTEGLA